MTPSAPPFGADVAFHAHRHPRFEHAVIAEAVGVIVEMADMRVSMPTPLARALEVSVREFFDIGPESARDNPRRSRIIVELVDAASSLNDADPELALDQMQALARKRVGCKR